MVLIPEETPAQGREDKERNVRRRFLTRIKNVFKWTHSNVRHSTLSTTPVAHRPASPSEATRPSTVANEALPTSQQSQLDNEGALPQADDTLQVKRIPKAEYYSRRAQQLAKHGIEIDPRSMNDVDGYVFRVKKATRVRIHRQCHKCGSGLDRSGTCDKCGHSFCSECTRNPPKLTEAEKIADREKEAQMLREQEANAMIVPDWNVTSSKVQQPIVVKMPRHNTHQRLVYKPIRMRVRRTCCQCLESDGTQVFFSGARGPCSKCNHARCTDCPRDPPRKDQYPYGYPGDEFGVKSIPHYKCHKCNAKFPPGIDNGAACNKCSHEKCDDCKRLKPRRVEPEPDPAVLKSVQEKLAAMTVKEKRTDIRPQEMYYGKRVDF